MGAFLFDGEALPGNCLAIFVETIHHILYDTANDLIELSCAILLFFAVNIPVKQEKTLAAQGFLGNGAKGIRTPDLFAASEAFSR